MSKRKKRGLIAGVIILTILAGLSLFISINQLYKKVTEYNENNTKEHTVTVVQLISNKKNYELIVKEYSCSLTVGKNAVIDESSLIKLSAGEYVTFNIPEFYDELLYDDRIESVPIVTLRTSKSAIVTFESNNNAQEKDFLMARITAGIFSGLFFCGAVTCLVFLIKNKKVYANESEQTKLL